MNKYGVLPSEETIFKDKIFLTVGDQLPTQQNTDAPLRLKYDPNYSNETHPLVESLPIQYTVPKESANLVLNFPLDTVGIEEIVRNIKLYKPSHVVLSGNSTYIKSYSDYRAELQDYLSKISAIPYTHIVIKNDTYLKEIINDAKSYSVESFTTERYGVCIIDKFPIIKLLNYKINQEVIHLITDKLNLSIEVDSICAPLKGVSNTIESVLWLLDFLFQANLANLYSTTVSLANSNNIYAVLAYQYAVEDSAVLYTSIKLIQNTTYYLTKNLKKNMFKLTVINKDTKDNVRIDFNLNSDATATLYRLVSNQGAGGTGGISFAELTLVDGIFKSARTTYDSKELSGVVIKPKEYIYSFIVPKLSACILKVPLTSSGGAFFEDINEYDEKDTIITVQPDKYDMNAPLTMSVRNFKNEYM